MKIALLCAYPISVFDDKVKFLYKRRFDTPSWNYNLSVELAKLPDTEVHVVTNAPLLRTKTIEHEGVYIHFVAHAPKVNFWEYITRFRYSLFTLGRVVRAINPDIIHASGTDHEYGYVSTLLGKPHVVTVHGVMKNVVKKMNYSRLSFMGMLSKFEEKTIRKTDHLIAIGKYVVNSFPYYSGKKYFIPNAIDKIFFNQIKTEDSDIVFVGRLIERKRVLNLILAFSKLLKQEPLTRLKICGAQIGDYYRRCVQLIEELEIQDNVTFLGHLNQQNVAKTLAACKILVIPSIEETAPMVCAESFAVGTPVVATAVGALPEMIMDGKTGILVTPDSVEQLAMGMGKLLFDNELRKECGKLAKESSKKYSPSIVAKATLQAYSDIIK